jgi:hypothetical protein
VSVIYAPKSNGLGGILGTLATLASATIPGMQWLAPVTAAARGVSQLASGNTAEGAKSLAGAATGLIKNPVATGAAKTTTPAATSSAVKYAGGPDLTDRMQANKALSQNTASAVPYTGGPDLTERMQIEKALQAQQINNRYNQLVAQYGNSPDSDLTARLQMNKNGGVENMSRYAALMARYPQLFQGR